MNQTTAEPESAEAIESVPEEEATDESQETTEQTVAKPPDDSITIPEELACLVNNRLQVLVQLDGLGRNRERIGQTQLPENVTVELNRQSKELRRMPDSEIAQTMRQPLEKRLTEMKERESAGDGGEEPPAGQ